MNKQQLASKIWESANKMRSKIEANEYKDYILGFIFYKFLSEKELRFLRENDYTEEDMDTVVEEDAETLEFVQRGIGYFISYENLFSTWLSMGSDFNVANVRNALSAFARLINVSHKKVFEGIFETLQTGLSKLGDTSASQTKAISDLIYLIKDIPMDGRQGYDVLGFIYEYLIGQFASNAGKKAGEFYTPHEVSLLMSEIVAEHLKDRSEIKIYDPTSGSGSLLINIGRSVAKYMENENNIKYYAQELKQNTYNLTRMNLVMRGIIPDNIVTRNGDTLEEDWPYFDENDPLHTYEPLYVDAVVSNPPYSQAWNPVDKETDARYARFGVAPKGKADYAFLLHDLYHLKQDGIMTIVLPHGVLFRGGEEGEIRKNLIEGNYIDAIIGLPANIFFGTGIPTIIMVLKQKRSVTDVLIIDASKGFAKVGKNNQLRASDIKRIADTVKNRQTIEKFSKIVSREEIRANEYNLNIPRYVDSSEEAETWDIYASMFGGFPVTEINQLDKFWSVFPNLKKDLFEQVSAGYCQLTTENIKQTVQEHPDICAFKNKFIEAFSGLEDYLSHELMDKMGILNITQEETVLSDKIFSCLSEIPLVDKYEAYQLLDDEWTKVASDLEIIQTEGVETIKKVVPNLVVKKKGGKDLEIQEGWKGYILPFELAQDTILFTEKQKLRNMESRMSEISAECAEILEEMSEEEKDADFVNEAKDAFVAAEIKKAIKSDSIEQETKEKLKKVNQLFAEEKDLKAKIKDQAGLLEQETKETIEGLSDEKAAELLKMKWIYPLIDRLMELPGSIITVLVSKLEKIKGKYETTFFEVEQQIRETEKELAGMLEELEGNEFDMQGLREFQLLLEGREER